MTPVPSQTNGMNYTEEGIAFNYLSSPSNTKGSSNVSYILDLCLIVHTTAFPF